MRVRRVSIHQFRGVPRELTLDLGPKPNSIPQSLILFGDNGTGKSSVVDAIEFALQARIRRSAALSNDLVPSGVSLAGAKFAQVEIGLSDGSVVERRIANDETVWRISDSKPHHLFATAPFVLRRSDILRFLETPEARRQLIFSDYSLTQSVEGEPHSDEQLEELPDEVMIRAEELRVKAKHKRRHLVELLARQIGANAAEVPSNRNAFDQFLVDRIYHGVTSNQAQRSGIERPKLDPYVRSLILRVRELFREISALNAEISKIRAIERKSDSPFHRHIRGVAQVLNDVGERITESFQETSSARFVDRVSLTTGDSGLTSLRVELSLSNGVICTPHQILSEANLDLLALLIFLAFAENAAERGQAKLLILDDIFQSVDATVRLSIADYIVRRFAGWQLIFTVHDRLWQEQLRQLLRQHGHDFVDREIVRWSFDAGPIIRDARSDFETPLLEALDKGDSVSICSQAGLLLEAVCDRLSWTLPISIRRKPGDKYTLGDLWPGIHKALRKTSASQTAANVDRWLHLRNLVGAHYNEWARSVSTEEARAFGEAVVELAWQVRCDRCFRWIEPISENLWGCRCQHVMLSSTA